MEKKKFTINVHFDYGVSIEVEAKNENEAIEMAKEKANNISIEEMDFCGFLDACVADIKYFNGL